MTTPVTASKGDVGVKISAAEANSFLSVPVGHIRVRRNGKWYHTMPDFPAYYRYYNSIGHYEGVLEIERIQQTYLHMLQLEQVYGKDAPYYQNTIGVRTPTQDARGQTETPSACDPNYDKGCTIHGAPPRTRKGPPRSHKRPNCNPEDPQCRHLPWYKGRGRVCDPYQEPSCRPVSHSGGTELKGPGRPPPKAMEYDCDPIYDNKCPQSMKIVRRRLHPQRYRGKGSNGSAPHRRGSTKDRQRNKFQGNFKPHLTKMGGQGKRSHAAK
ncbi:hypothetical protein NDU88_004904 [Pleurodeles waltl]|uniref:Uncharacterized protein n=1 Tax=Pleurodeles waltl TaxID=8319 RepID=A0AAV7L0R2_PLEWA|nr:hypothetical protein NDU88_004904 [Pleurodeles waltl]